MRTPTTSESKRLVLRGAIIVSRRKYEKAKQKDTAWLYLT